MAGESSNEYLKNAVMTAPPEQLQLMLYDGAIRFAGQARTAMEQKQYDASCELLLKAQRIVLELQNGLRPEVNPSLCGQMAALYQFIYRRLVDANMQRDAAAIDDALRILGHQRETWDLLIQKLREGSAAVTTVAMRPNEAASLSVRC